MGYEADNISLDFETKNQTLAGDYDVVHKSGMDKMDSLSGDMRRPPPVATEKYSGISISFDDLFCNSSCRAKRNAETQAIAQKAETDRQLAEAVTRMQKLEAESAALKAKNKLSTGAKIGIAVGGVALVLFFLKAITVIAKPKAA